MAIEAMSQTTIREAEVVLESPFYIPMTGPAARPRRSLKYDDTLIMLDSRGDIGASAGGSVTIIGARDAHGMLGRDVRSPTDEDMGRIVDVIVDRAGSVRAAVVDLAAFLASAVEKSSSTGTRCISGASPTRATALRSS
jgi:hypothetical protein